MGLTQKILNKVPNDVLGAAITKGTSLNTGLSIGLGAVGLGALAFGPPMLAAHNRASMGEIVYEPGMSRMTKPINRGTVRAMKQAADGDPKIFNDMAKGVVRNGNALSSAVEDYGVDTNFVSAFYGV